MSDEKLGTRCQYVHKSGAVCRTRYGIDWYETEFLCRHHAWHRVREIRQSLMDLVMRINLLDRGNPSAEAIRSKVLETYSTFRE